MRLFLTLLPLILAFPAFVGVFIHHLHMFQLNSYHYDVERKWIAKNIGFVFFFFMLCAAGAASVVIFTVLLPDAAVYVCGPLLTLIFCGIWLYFKYRRMTKKAKKPLVYTDRVKRLILTGMLLFFVPTALIFFIVSAAGGGEVRGGYTALLYETAVIGLTPFYLQFCNLVNTPVEASVRKKYTNKAIGLLRDNKNLKVIGVTGSYGKTSVKYFLSSILQARYNVLMTPENFNTPMGVVRTVNEHLSPLHEVFVCEMGAKRVGEIRELCDLVHPSVGVITAVGPQHLDTFGSQDNVRKTKFELAYALPKDGTVFLNADSPELMIENYPGRCVYYSIEGKGDYNAQDIRLSGEGTAFTLVHGDERCEFMMPLIGRHNVQNVTGAIAVAHELGLSFEEIRPRVRMLQGVPHRLQLMDKGRFVIIDDAYNSNPEGARAAVETLKMFDGFRILVTPGMVELGEKMYECNKRFGTQAASCCDYAILVGEKQAPPIRDGLLEGGMAEDKIYTARDFSEAIAHAYALDTHGKKPFILLENDLPDNF